MMQEQLLVLLGPTACGKTGIGVSLAQRLNGEIISADSVAVYHGLSIGSARPTLEEQCGIAHHLLDCVDCDTLDFSVAKYKELAVRAIDGVLSRQRLPILVGGSGLYIDALTAPMTYAITADPALRNELNQEYLQDPDAFWKRLYEADPATAGRLHLHDQKRIVRAMEIFRLTGVPMSRQTAAYATRQGETGAYSCRKIGLMMEREALYCRINARVDAMMCAGLLEEARRLYDRQLDRSLPAMKSIGYAQLFEYFDGLTTLSDAVDAIKRDTRRFAKRQMTWFRRDASIVWYPWERYSTESNLTQAILRDLEDR